MYLMLEESKNRIIRTQEDVDEYREYLKSAISSLSIHVAEYFIEKGDWLKFVSCLIRKLSDQGELYSLGNLLWHNTRNFRLMNVETLKFNLRIVFDKKMEVITNSVSNGYILEINKVGGIKLIN